MNVVVIYAETGSLKETARVIGVSAQKVRRLLLTAGIIPDNPRTVEIQYLRRQGTSVDSIAKKLKISKKAVLGHLPYQKVEYGRADASENAIRIRRYRQKQCPSQADNTAV